jgi:hypothetical protein
LQKSTSYTRRLKGAARVFEEILQRKLWILLSETMENR